MEPTTPAAIRLAGIPALPSRKKWLAPTPAAVICACPCFCAHDTGKRRALPLVSAATHRTLIMLIGVPTEIKDHECRVALTPEGAHALCGEGHGVLVQRGAGARVGLRDEDYAAAGARLAGDAADIWARAELM